MYLKRLDLSNSLAGNESVEQFVQSSGYRYLEFLKLKNCHIGNSGFTSLVSSSNLRRLKVLILTNNSINKLIYPVFDSRGG